MRNRDDQELFEAVRRGRLTPREEERLESYLAAHPDEQPGLGEELNLSRLLHRLPDVPVASNFTSRVLQMAAAERKSPVRFGTSIWRPRFPVFSWLRTAGLACSVLFISFFLYQQSQISHRAELAESVATVFGAMSVLSSQTPAAKSPAAEPALAALPTIEMLENFEAIQRLDQLPHEVDVDLLAALAPAP